MLPWAEQRAGNWEQVKFEWWGERYSEWPTLLFSRMEFCRCLSFTNRCKKLEGQILPHLCSFFPPAEGKKRREHMMYAASGNIVRGHKVRILTFSQASGICQWSCWCEYLLASLILVLLQVPSPTPSSSQALSYFTATVPLSRGCSRVWEDLVYFGWYFA